MKVAKVKARSIRAAPVMSALAGAIMAANSRLPGSGLRKFALAEGGQEIIDIDQPLIASEGATLSFKFQLSKATADYQHFTDAMASRGYIYVEKSNGQITSATGVTVLIDNNPPAAVDHRDGKEHILTATFAAGKQVDRFYANSDGNDNLNGFMWDASFDGEWTQAGETVSADYAITGIDAGLTYKGFSAANIRSLIRNDQGVWADDTSSLSFNDLVMSHNPRINYVMGRDTYAVGDAVENLGSGSDGVIGYVPGSSTDGIGDAGGMKFQDAAIINTDPVNIPGDKTLLIVARRPTENRNSYTYLFSTNNEFDLILNYGGADKLSLFRGSILGVGTLATTFPRDDEYHLLIATHVGDEVVMYKDGIEVDRHTTGTFSLTYDAMYFGRTTTGQRPVDFDMAACVFIEKGLTAEDVTALQEKLQQAKNAQNSPPTNIHEYLLSLNPLAYSRLSEIDNGNIPSEVGSPFIANSASVVNADFVSGSSTAIASSATGQVINSTIPSTDFTEFTAIVFCKYMDSLSYPGFFNLASYEATDAANDVAGSSIDLYYDNSVNKFSFWDGKTVTRLGPYVPVDGNSMVLVYDGAKIELFIGGISRGSMAYSGTFSNIEHLLLGGQQMGQKYRSKFEFSHFCVVPRALTGAEVIELDNFGKGE